MIYGDKNMEEMITLCGDNCMKCPRYNANSNEELEQVAKLWYRIGLRDTIVSTEEINCRGCSPHKQCAYQLFDCIEEHKVLKCNQCVAFPCEKIKNMLKKSKLYQEKCKEICSKQEYEALTEAFFNKEANLYKEKEGK